MNPQLSRKEREIRKDLYDMGYKQAEQDFLKILDNPKIATANGTLIIKKLLKSTIQKEKTEE